MSCLNITTATRVLITTIFTVSLYCQTSSVVAAEITPERVLASNCLSSYQGKYLKLKNQKAFSYARERETGKHRCGWSYGYKTVEKARENSLKQCAKRTLNAECKIVDENGKFLAREGDFSPITPIDNNPLTDNERNKLIDEAGLLVEGSCLPFFKKYLNNKGHKAFAYSLDTDGRYACGKSSKKNILEAAQKGAISSCEKNKAKRKKPPQTACKVYAKNDEIVLAGQDYGIKKGESDYRRAILRGNLQKIRQYVAEGVDVNLVSKDGTSPLFVAAIKGDEAFFHQLVKKGANLGQKANDGSSLLIAAVMGQNPNIIRYLLDKGFDINAQGRENNTALHVAFMRLNSYLIGMLMQEGADPTIKNTQDVSGYDLGKKWKVDLDDLKTLDVQRKKSGCTQVFYAAKEGDVIGLEKMAALNADMNRACDDGLSPLSFAKNEEKVIRTLVKLGADVNKADEDGQTPLMYSVKDGEDRIKLLLALGADKTIKDNEGNTAYDLVKNKKTVGDGVKTLLK